MSLILLLVCGGIFSIERAVLVSGHILVVVSRLAVGLARDLSPRIPPVPQSTSIRPSPRPQDEVRDLVPGEEVARSVRLLGDDLMSLKWSPLLDHLHPSNRAAVDGARPL
jgi:hypothetical protein